MEKIGLGGGCHWCTEAVFKSLKGVVKVEQGFISANGPNAFYSEGIILHYAPEAISLDTLIEIHLHTHNSTADHSMRMKYRSAVYTFSLEQTSKAKKSLLEQQAKFEWRLVTKVLPFAHFKPSEERYILYYHSDPDKPFCKRYIDPKLKWLQKEFGNHTTSVT